MTIPPAQGTPTLKGWLILVTIFAVAGAVLGGPGRGPMSGEDADWRKWVGIVLQWAVMGALIGYLSSRLQGRKESAVRVAALYVVTMPLFMLAVEGLRLAAAWYTGGWDASATSVAVGAVAGVLTMVPLMMLMGGAAKLLRRARPTPPAA